ncbi:MAG: amidase [Gammaproteobacteria bacterium]|nr:amidase [Gammaproteobacteria bacterium]
MNKQTLVSLTILTAIILTGCNDAKNSTSLSAPNNTVDNLQARGVIALTLPEIAAQLAENKISSEQLVQLYLDRIEQIDRNGPKLQSVLSINPDAIKLAKERDQQRKAGNIKGPLHGVPILLKDNIESNDAMPTTAGALALKNNFTDRDSPLVAGLKAQGAIILGKTNLSQWANFRSENSMSGWSALGGQVRNPHMLDRNPCGSSSGSGAAAAASLAAGAVGTETNGSIICPSNINGVVGFKPTVGVVPQQYIVPISYSQDTAGPMTKSVKGAAMLMDAMAIKSAEMKFTDSLDKSSLEGVKVGVLTFAQGNNKAITDLFMQAQHDLKKAGAVLVNIEERPNIPANYYSMAYDLLKFEFKHGINQYLASTPQDKVSTRTLEQLIAFNLDHVNTELALFDQSIFVASEAMDSLESQEYKNSVELVQTTSRNNIDSLLKTYQVDVLIVPSGPLSPRIDPINGDVWPNDWPGYGGAAAHAGYPHATVPMGGFNALPVGLSFIGGKNKDVQLLSFAYAYEQQAQRRLSPQYFKNAEALSNIEQAMSGHRE